MNSFIKKAFSLLLIGCFLVLGLGVVRVNADTSSWSLIPTDFTKVSYADNNGSHEKGGIAYVSYQVMQSSSKIQFKKSDGYIYSTSPFSGDIVSVSLDDAVGTFKVYFSSSPYNAKPSNGEVAGNNNIYEAPSESLYFCIACVGSSAGTLNSITITYTQSSGSEPDPDPVAVTGVSLNKTSLNLEVGDSETLTATVAPANASNPNVTWSSSDEDVATIENGVVTAVTAGNATITVTTVDGSKAADCDVTVTEFVPVLTVGKYYALQNILEGDDLNELTGVTTIGTAGSPSEIAAYPLLVERGSTANSLSFKNSDNYLSWSSGNSLATSVDKDNYSSWLVTENEGNYSIINVADNSRKLQYNSGSPRFACYTSSQSKVKLVLLYSVSFESNGGSSVDSINYIYNDNKINKPANPTKNGFVFSGWYKDSELNHEWDFDVDTVTKDTTLYAKWEDESQAIHVESVSLNKSSTSIEVGETETLIASISPDNAANKNVTWSSSDETIATVSNGVVTGVKAGTATITVTSADNNEITDTCLVTVTAIPTYIVSVEGGKFDNDATIDEFERGDTVSVSPVENSYEIFTFWSDAYSNVLSYDKYYTFTVNSDLEVFANFKSKDMFIDLTNSEGSIDGGAQLENLNSFSNCEYLISISCVYAYKNANYGIKFGKGEGKGSITITLKDGFTATGIRIKAKTYGTDSTVLFVNSNDETKQTLTTTTNIYEYSFNATNKIIISPSVASKQRFYVYTIEILGINTYSSVKIQGSVGLDANSKGAFRLLGVAGSDAYGSYGVAYKNSTGTWHELTELDVYDSVYAYDGAEKVSYTAAELGGSVIFGVEVIGLPKGVYTVSIKSFVEIDSVKYYSAERTFTITVSDSGVNIVDA